MDQTSQESFDYSSFVLALSSATLSYLGIHADGSAAEARQHLVLAKQNIDIISMLREKTKGNLNAEESKLTDQVLTDLRMKYVEASKV